ncbi:MAG: ATP-binding protein [Treponema sp.]|jgi:predicted AAA+ superfamily ATPase|nr:ATP-binding protein [Treponema sp.]
MDITTIGRRINDVVYARSREEPVILLDGPRASGKSTALHLLAARYQTVVFDLDDQPIRDDAARDPGFYTRPRPSTKSGMVLIDEYQRVPAILDAIKERMNVSCRPGQFILTGSTRHNALPGSVQSLTGRLHRMEIYPFSQSEMAGTQPDLIAKLIADPAGTVERIREKPHTETREGYAARITKGGFPLAVQREGTARNRWFDNYLRQIVERDIPGVARIRNKRGLSALLRYVAAQTAQILTVERAAAAAAIDFSTARDYLQLLEDVFMIYELPAWGRTLRSIVGAKPKIHILDSGIASRLLGVTTEKLNAKEPSTLTEFGHLLESFTVTEIFKDLSWIDDTFLTGHWHTHDGKEVDFIIETHDGSVYGFEIKTGSRTVPDVFSGLSALRAFAGTAFKAGFVFYTGAQAFKAEDRIFVLPLSALWE